MTNHSVNFIMLNIFQTMAVESEMNKLVARIDAI
jgi:hypothetical protein